MPRRAIPSGIGIAPERVHAGIRGTGAGGFQKQICNWMGCKFVPLVQERYYIHPQTMGLLLYLLCERLDYAGELLSM